MKVDIETLRQVLAAVPKVAFFILDDGLRHRMCGGDAQVLADLGFVPGEVEGKQLGYSLDSTDVWRANIDAAHDALERGVTKEGLETVWRARYYESACVPVREHGDIVGCVLSVRDVSHRKRNDMQLEAFARTDPLTGLANKNRFQIVLRRMTRGSVHVCVALFDLDGFKHLNDTQGHAAGDACLRAVSRSLEATTRGTDTVARMGGDEFAVLLVPSPEHVTTEIVERMRAGIIAAVPGVSASVGVATFPTDSTDPDVLLRKADEAMFADKRERKATR